MVRHTLTKFLFACVPLLTASLLGAGCAGLEDFAIGGELQFWQTVDAKMKYRDGISSTDGDTIDLVSDVGLDDQPSIIAGGVFVRFHRTIYQLDIWHYQDDSVADFGLLPSPNNKRINGNTFAGITNVDVSIDMLRFVVQQGLVDQSGIYLHFTVGVEGFMGSYEFNGTSSNLDEPFAIVPIVGGYMEIYHPELKRLRFFGDAQVTFIDLIDQDAVNGDLIDVRVGARYEIAKGLLVALGYRFFKADFDLDTGSGGDFDRVSFEANGFTLFITGQWGFRMDDY